MAMIDYGAIVFKNGKLITHDMFTPMKEAVGWEDVGKVELDYYGEPLHLKGQYFTYIGDSEATIGFYKNGIKVVQNYGKDIFQHYECFQNEYKWSKWTDYIGNSECVVKHRNGYYVLRWKYKGDKYKVYFVYGVDLGSYEKWRIVNYYRSLPFYFGKMKWELDRKVKMIKYKLGIKDETN